MESISVIVPVYNEEKVLEGVTKEILQYMNSLKLDYEILICNNGSIDKSEEITKKLAKQNKNIKSFYTPQKGIGSALRLGIKNANNEYITYLPSDGEMDYSFIERALPLMKEYDLITGSRYTKMNLFWKDYLRMFLSMGLVYITRIMMPLPITEIGPAKMFRKNWALSLLNRTKEEGWGWQLELLTCAAIDKLKLKEIPVTIKLRRGREESKMNFLKDGIDIFKSIIKSGLTIRYNIIKNKLFRRF